MVTRLLTLSPDPPYVNVFAMTAASSAAALSAAVFFDFCRLMTGGSDLGVVFGFGRFMPAIRDPMGVVGVENAAAGFMAGFAHPMGSAVSTSSSSYRDMASAKRNDDANSNFRTSD